MGRRNAETDVMDPNAKVITCKDCGCEFVVSEKEQNWYKERGFELPKRCYQCRKDRREKDASKSKSKSRRKGN